jgi:hypothetical protein
LRLEIFRETILLNAKHLSTNCVDKIFVNLVRGNEFLQISHRKTIFFISSHPNSRPHYKGGDQMANLAEVVNKHLGVMVRWPEVTEVSLASAIASVLEDPTFQVDTL